MGILNKYNLHYGNERDTVISINELKSVSNKEKRYDFFELRNIVEHSLGFNVRGCENNLVKLGFNIPKDTSIVGIDRYKYCDYWHYQLNAVFRRAVHNDSANSIYVGTKRGISYKKVKIKPNEWQKMILEKWNELLYPLADKNGWIKVVIWW
ncbi:hypothetical protein [Clostridium sp.]|uniref:hypothetical protein n=1 Tax=Clostridium sp. TaxID=1506 RepID=UPI001D5F3479|nr:hypothetical protein [Clostridium sp.]MBS5307815.1 hypothetical protein [Clostridium sp.]